MFCSNCGNELKNGNVFCGKCGNKVGEITGEKSVVIETESAKQLGHNVKQIKLDKNIYAYIISAIVIFMMIVPFCPIFYCRLYQMNFWNGNISEASNQSITIIDIIEEILDMELWQQEEAMKMMIPEFVMIILTIVIVCCGASYLKASFLDKKVDEQMLYSNMILSIAFGGVAIWCKFAAQNFYAELFSPQFSCEYSVATIVWIMIFAAVINYCILYKTFENEEKRERMNSI